MNDSPLCAMGIKQVTRNTTPYGSSIMADVNINGKMHELHNAELKNYIALCKTQASICRQGGMTV